MKLTKAEIKLVLRARREAAAAKREAARKARVRALRAELRRLDPPALRLRCTCDAQSTNPNCPILKAGGYADPDGPCQL